MGTKLPEKVEKLLVTFKKAIEAEKESQATYLEAKELTDDELLKKVFEDLYQDEVRHEQELVKRYNTLRQECCIDDA